MKKLAEEATTENVLNSIKENKYNRTQDIKDFIMALEQIEGNMFISLDAKWGAGKTFYVRQIEQTLNYLTKKFKGLDIEQDVEDVFSNSLLSKTKINYTYLPIYYDAWLYDNHVDPLMSLMQVFNSIIVENVQKLVIFIDELDRCRPNFAIEMLERIKHYFDDDRIIFVASINREQLIHSISKYYGTNFDSTGYLDKFFDRNVYLPEIDTRFGEKSQVSFTDRQYRLENVASGLNDYFRLSLRENMRYYEYISFAASSNYVNDNGYRGFMFSAFIPIVAILGIKDENEKRKFLNGEGNILTELFENVPALRELASRFGEERNNRG